MPFDFYPYHFVQRINDVENAQLSFLKYKLLYAFKSPKSHQWYWVWVEVYEHNLNPLLWQNDFEFTVLLWQPISQRFCLSIIWWWIKVPIYSLEEPSWRNLRICCLCWAGSLIRCMISLIDQASWSSPLYGWFSLPIVWCLQDRSKTAYKGKSDLAVTIT